MSELDRALSGGVIVAYNASNGSLGPSGASGFAKTIMPDETLMVNMSTHMIPGGGRWISNVTGIEVMPVPEPGTLLLLFLGVGTLTGLRRRFQR